MTRNEKINNRIEYVIAELKKGRFLTDIAKEIGITQHSIRDNFRTRNIDIKQYTMNSSEAVKKSMNKLVADGKFKGNTKHGYCGKSGIYVIEDQITGKRYVGSTIDLGRRKAQYSSKKTNENIVGRNKTKRTGTIRYQILEHGWKSFTFEVLEYADNGKLAAKEAYWIGKLDTFENGYNTSPTGK